MSVTTLSTRRYFPAVLGLGSLLALLIGLEGLIRLCDVPLWHGDQGPVSICPISPFAVPLPSDVFWAVPRIVVEEHVFARFLLTAGAALLASVLVTIVGIAGGVLLYRLDLLRLATETWVAAIAAAPLIL